jgi:hypothetical protein
MTDDELDDGLLRLLRQAREDEEDGKTNDRATMCSDLAAQLGQPGERVHARLQELAIGKVTESEAIPDAWMIVLPSDRR